MPDAGSENDPDTIFVLPDSDVSAVVRSADGVAVSEINDMHGIGVNDCPQLIGTVTVDNGGDSTATATLSLPTGSTVALDLGGSPVSIAAGQSGEMVVEFTCSATDNIDTVLDLSLEFDGRVGVFEVPVTLSVM